MNLAETLRARRSVRAYTGEPLDEATVRALLDAAVQAPSAMNGQPWAFAIVQDRAALQRYSDRAKELLLARPDARAIHARDVLGYIGPNIFYDAGTLIAIGVRQRGDYAEADCWLAAENLMLAAASMGLGTCCIGFAIPVLNTMEVKRELGFGPEGAVVAPIIAGRPRGTAEPVARDEPRVLRWVR